MSKVISHSKLEIKLMYEQLELLKDHMKTIVTSLDLISSQVYELKDLEKDLEKEYNTINRQYKKLCMKVERIEEGLIA